MIVSGNSEGFISFWDLESGAKVYLPRLLVYESDIIGGDRPWADVLAVAQRQERTVLIFSSTNGSIHLWDLERDEAVGAPLTGHKYFLRALAVAERHGRIVIVSGSPDDSIRLWDLERGEALGALLTGHTAYALAVAQRQGRTVIVSGCDDGSIRLWDFERGEAVGAPLTGHTARVDALAVAQQQGRTVIVSGSKDGIRICEGRSCGQGVAPRPFLCLAARKPISPR